MGIPQVTIMPVELSSSTPANLPLPPQATKAPEPAQQSPAAPQSAEFQQEAQRAVEQQQVEAAAQTDQADLNNVASTPDVAALVQATRAQASATSTPTPPPETPEPEAQAAASSEYENNQADFERTTSGEVQPAVDSFV